MISEWLKRVGSSIPRGFSRYFILEVLKEKPCTGKEIIDIAIKKSGGEWKPSPGLIYPMLQRLQDEKLIRESDNNKYIITEIGINTNEDLNIINNIVKKQLNVLFRIGNIGKFITMDLLERIKIMSELLNSNMTKDETEQYKKFLRTELEKIEGTENNKWKNISIE